MHEYTEKGSYPVDEVKYIRYNLKIIKDTLALSGNPEYESLAKRMAYIDAAVIYMMYEDAYYNGKHHFRDKYTITKQIRKLRPDLNVTDEEIDESLQRCVVRKRFVVQDFVNDFNMVVKKWVYNKYYEQPSEIPQVITYTHLPPVEKNHLMSDEFLKMIEDGIK